MTSCQPIHTAEPAERAAADAVAAPVQAIGAVVGDLYETFEGASRDAGLSHDDLWLRYFALGGMRSAFEVEAILYGALTPTIRDRDLIALVLNERFAELGANHPIPYVDGEDEPEPQT
jgi:hypothetical protein